MGKRKLIETKSSNLVENEFFNGELILDLCLECCCFEAFVLIQISMVSSRYNFLVKKRREKITENILKTKESISQFYDSILKKARFVIGEQIPISYVEKTEIYFNIAIVQAGFLKHYTNNEICKLLNSISSLLFKQIRNIRLSLHIVIPTLFYCDYQLQIYNQTYKFSISDTILKFINSNDNIVFKYFLIWKGCFGGSPSSIIDKQNWNDMISIIAYFFEISPFCDTLIPIDKLKKYKFN